MVMNAIITNEKTPPNSTMAKNNEFRTSVTLLFKTLQTRPKRSGILLRVTKTVRVEIARAVVVHRVVMSAIVVLVVAIGFK